MFWQALEGTNISSNVVGCVVVIVQDGEDTVAYGTVGDAEADVDGEYGMDQDV